MPTKDDVTYVGISIGDFLEQTDRQMKAGTFTDGTAIKPQAREALGALSKSLRAVPQARIRNYVFCGSRHCIIVINF